MKWIHSNYQTLDIEQISSDLPTDKLSDNQPGWAFCILVLAIARHLSVTAPPFEYKPLIIIEFSSSLKSSAELIFLQADFHSSKITSTICTDYLRKMNLFYCQHNDERMFPKKDTIRRIEVGRADNIEKMSRNQLNVKNPTSAFCPNQWS